ncbi:MAG: 4-hydroxyphenylpyruvate dioxygenase [Bdellovibrionales bacterium RIFCSPHIGHO2_01_FULL_40_29]|nr:MAG: 4-hydroxyphenylpyruvate dioxygenase [Bdellovibrionales bacterium RIFCSPHIGHO2_01_FULL_40_29]OFZ34869.1 MAG: 4-hydroxyphenylpyruvate dioxygenase [Bdellovibrionales bacterium RIFCSPHIGHO2_02_FULL_40_15]
MMKKNPLGLNGIEFVEFSSDAQTTLHQLFTDFGFSKLAVKKNQHISYYRQGQIIFHLNTQADSFGDRFQKLHGPSISSMGWRFNDPDMAYREALQRGAQPCLEGDYFRHDGTAVPAIYGIGGSLIYFVEQNPNLGFIPLQNPEPVAEKGFLLIDHLTNNVAKGTMQEWAHFYKTIFGFEEVRYFDIKGQKTGLTSYALRSPCGQFCIPINEADEAKSQINEFLEEYNGPGVQHLAFLTRDLLSSIQKLKGTQIETLDIASDYYEKAFARVPAVKEDKNLIQSLNVLVDGDEKGYLLQIFTKKLVGPIFIELIQRENHLSFGEGNFQALFDSIERDQMKRGVL